MQQEEFGIVLPIKETISHSVTLGDSSDSDKWQCDSDEED